MLIKIVLMLTFLCALKPFPSYSLTLQEALALSRENLPFYRASTIQVKASEALYDAALAPYLPSLDLSASGSRYYTSSDEYSIRAYDLTLSYSLFDGGKRKANKDIARLNLNIDKEGLRKALLDLDFNVKTAFYTVVARLEILKQREIQLQDAQKDYEVAEGRYRFGVARLSDVLQASVRLEQAKFNLVQAEGDAKKAMSELNSLIGRPLDTRHDIKAVLEISTTLPDKDKLSYSALNRPEIKQAELSIAAAERSKFVIKSAFYPAILLSASHTNTKVLERRDILTTPNIENNIIKISASWNIFELGKFFKHKASQMQELISVENLNETKRLLLLEVHKTYEDLITSLGKIKVAEEQLKQAEHNYLQAFNEYKIGKGDMLALVQAESLLSDAREQMIISKLDFVLTKTRLERVAAIDSMEAL